MKERKFKVKIRMQDDREEKSIRQAIPGVRAYSSSLSRAIEKEKTEARIKKFNESHPDYKPPNHGNRKK